MSALLAAIKPRQRWISLTLQLAVKGEPALIPALAPALMWAKLMWTAQTRAQWLPAGHPNLRVLLSWWEASCRSSGKQLTWANSTGPVQRTILALGRIGWAANSAFQWVDQHGTVLHLGLISPKQIQIKMSMAMQEVHEQNAAVHLGDFGGVNRVYTAHLKQFHDGKTKLSKNATPWERYVAYAAPCKALVTRKELCRMGYDVSPLCPMCQKCEDSVFHRAWECDHPEVAEARSRVAEPDLVRQALNSSEVVAWTTGHVQHPATIYDEAAQATEAGVELLAASGQQMDLSTHVFNYPFVATDGSHYPSDVIEWSRSGWSCVFHG